MVMTTNMIILSGTTVQTIVGANNNRTFLTIQNIGSQTLFLGGSGNVTSSIGYPIFPGAVYEDSIYTGSYFGVAPTGSNTTITYIEED